MSATAGEWSDPKTCPFCGDGIENGGAGFVDHVGQRPTCERRVGRWRERVREDVPGGWSG